MFRSSSFTIVALGVAMACHQLEAATPRQSSLLGPITDVSTAFGGGPTAMLTSSAASGTDGVNLTFNTDNSAGSDQAAFEWETFDKDLSAFSDFSVSFTPNALVTGAQLFLRSEDPNNPGTQQFIGVGGGLTANTTSKISIDLATVTWPQNIIGFGVQFFTGGASITGAQVKLSAAASVSVANDVLYSWEGAGNFDGWSVGFDADPDTTHALSSIGATLGTQSLQITRAHNDLPANGTENDNYRFGSERLYGTDTPERAAELASLGARINAADAIAFDVTLNDPIDLVEAGVGPDPSFAGFHLVVSDSNNFFQGPGQFFNPVAPATPTTNTYRASLAELIGQGNTNPGQSIAEVGFLESSNFARIAIATNTNGAGLYQLDNFRLITETTINSADFNLDSKVDAADLAIWRTALGVNNDGDADFDGDTDGNDFLVWQRQLSAAGATVNVGGVPEPAAIALFASGLAAIALSRRTGLAPRRG